MNNSRIYGVAIVGCGLIGQKRAKALGPAHLVICADTVTERAQSLANSFSGAIATTEWREAVERDDIDIVIVATTNDQLALISEAAVRAGKHVLVEKPAARNVKELEPVIQAADSNHRLVRVGFNHRYHPAMLNALEIFKSGNLGRLMFIRGRYGHGGRVGYDQEWRANPIISGGGELIDQGIHLIDLSRLFMHDFSDVSGFAHTYFWKMPVDDNAFLLLRTPEQQAAFLHVSCTEWKNLFSFEIYCEKAKLHIEGLGGSYGIERLAYYRMLPEMGPPDTTIWEYPQGDNSWAVEFREFLEDIEFGRQPAAGLHDAKAALVIVEKVIKDSGYDYHP